MGDSLPLHRGIVQGIPLWIATGWEAGVALLRGRSCRRPLPFDPHPAFATFRQPEFVRCFPAFPLQPEKKPRLSSRAVSGFLRNPPAPLQPDRVGAVLVDY